MCLSSHGDLHVIRDTCHIQLGNGLRGSLAQRAMTENIQQGAEDRSCGKEARGKERVLFESGNEKLCRNVIFGGLIPNLQMCPPPVVLKFITAQHPPCLVLACSLPLIPPETRRQAFILILITAPGTAFHPQPCRTVISKWSGCQTVYYYQTMRGGRRTWLQGVGVELGKDFGVTHVVSLWADNKCLSPGLISASVGQLQGSQFYLCAKV